MQPIFLSPLLKNFFCGTLLLAGCITGFQLIATETGADPLTLQNVQAETFANVTTENVPLSLLLEWFVEKEEEEKDSPGAFKSIQLISQNYHSLNQTSLKAASSALGVHKRYLLFHCLRLYC